MADDITLREPTAEDGAELHALVRTCKPLDENSLYCNLLQCSHFSETCCVAEMDGRMVGFVSGYRPPKQADVYFLWQVGVHPDAAGKGLARRMIQHILARPVCAGVTELNTTITKSNEPSRALFASLARHEGADMKEEEFFTAEHFGGSGHEAEYLFRIGPLSTPPAA
ncbi:MAG: diaminobutyrate acetyltransferase [Alcanivoracaceae bacterium]|jgi:L-2,4-diaminobutyric acid acetyltransferase|nr:diaminobutyrate acetyltransferase [Alcanivoracaceae bacterium]